MGKVTKYTKSIDRDIEHTRIAVFTIQLDPLWIHGYQQDKTICESV